MAESKEEWELSKENIQPIQQGRKADIIKILKPLTAHPEELILQQKQAFEQELRTYSGDDPLAVWCKYIKWVEQNFPKGGKDGHIKELIKHCLSILIKETKYKDDCRFIEIWLKFANMSTNPMEVFDYMYSHNIGCKSATFFISWAWELEQLGNYTKANEILTEGIHRKAQPFEKLKASHLEFETRLVGIVMNGLDQNNSKTENGRSAFSMLKPQKKKPPISRTGESVIETNRTTLTLGRQQPQPRSSISSTKVPFQIYNSENIAPPLPVQANTDVPFILNSGNKENERKAGKWNKVKVKQQGSLERGTSESDLGFKFHCDDTPQPTTMPRDVPKISKILTPRHGSVSPPMALFEPPDPKKHPMYNKNKVYGGAEEYSLEEIRAAAWFEKNKEKIFAEQQKTLTEHAKKEQQMKKIIETLTQQLEYLTSNVPDSAIKQSSTSNTIIKTPITGIIAQKSKDIASNMDMYKSEVKQPAKCTKSTEVPISKVYVNSDKFPSDKVQNLSSGPLINTVCMAAAGTMSTAKNDHALQNYIADSLVGKYTESRSYREAANMVQELYNGTLNHLTEEIINSDASECRDSKIPFGLNQNADSDALFGLILPDSNIINQKLVKSNDYVANLPFTLFHDPTDVLPQPSKNATRQDFSNGNLLQNALLSEPDAVCWNDGDSSKDDENIPPEGYVQETKKRELAGILEPSKNILFIPLEQQEEMEDDLDPEDTIVKSGNPSHETDTLVLPSNTEQFAIAGLPASTPSSDVNKNLKPRALKETSTEPSNCIQYENDPQDPCFSASNEIKCQPVLNKNETIKSTKDQITPLKMQNDQLSVIMEASRESYKTSSSSSSSTSSVNLTKSCHLDHCQQNLIRKLHSTVTSKVSPLGSVPEYPNSGSAYLKENILPQRYDEVCGDETAKSVEIFYTDLDPFGEQLIGQFMESLNEKLCDIDKMHHNKNSVKSIKLGENVKVGDKTYIIENFIAEGSYAKVFLARNRYCDSLNPNYSMPKTAFKVCKTLNLWELYICEELQKRLMRKNDLPNISKSIMSITSSIKYDDGIVLLTDYSQHGTLLQLVNYYKSQNSCMPELITMYFSLELLLIVSKMHECNIIHCDIKPDNILINNNSLDCVVVKNIEQETTSLRLIDFGRAIDLNLFKKGICFKTKLKTEFQCIEMREDNPWVYQLDWYGVLSCIHVMLFAEYMIVKKNKDNKWEIGKKFKRYSCTALWIPLFNDLLNIPACYQQPNLKPYISLIQSKLEQNYTSFTFQMKRLEAYFKKKN